MSQRLNYKHLYYFWVVAKQGGLSRAASRLGIAVQTVSAQVRELERSLGFALLRPAGRGVALTEAGQVALRQAEAIFELGEQLGGLVREAATAPVLRLTVGISDGLPKMAVRHLLQPALSEPNLRLLCLENRYEDLLAELALHRLDVVLSDRSVVPTPNLKLHSHSLGRSPLAWYAPPSLFPQARRGFPQSLARVPLLLPTTHAAVRVRLDQWFEREGIQPHIAGEFEDSALLATFGASGMGVFPAAVLAHEELLARHGVQQLGECAVEEQFFAIGTEKRVAHPLVARLLDARG